MKEKKEDFVGARSTLKTIYKIATKIGLALLIFIALFLLYVGISHKLYQIKGGKKYEPAFSLYSIISPSMRPTINVYDIIIDKKVNKPTDIKEGDIITFLSTSSYSKGLTVTHRVMEVKKNQDGKYEYLTKGDNNMSPDAAYAPYENVLGKVIFRVPQFGRIQEFLSNKGGWILVVIIPALIIIIKDIIKLIKLANIEEKASTSVKNDSNTNQKPKKRNKNLEESRQDSIKRKLDE